MATATLPKEASSRRPVRVGEGATLGIRRAPDDESPLEASLVPRDEDVISLGEGRLRVTGRVAEDGKSASVRRVESTPLCARA